MRCRYKQQKLTLTFLAGIAQLGLLGGAQRAVWSQIAEKPGQVEQTLIGPKATYRTLPAYRVCPKGVNIILPAPDGKAALVQHQRTERSPDGQSAGKFGGETTTELFLVSPDSDHAQVVWRGGGSPSTGYTAPVSIKWLPGTQSAVVQVLTLTGPMPKPDSNLSREPQLQASLLLINVKTGTVQTIAPIIPSGAYLMVSHDQPLAVLVDSKTVTVQRLEKDKLRPPLAIKTLKKQDALIWYQILPDNRTLVGAGLEAQKDGTRRQRVVYHVDTITGSATVVGKPENAATMRLEPARPVGARLPFTVRRGKETMTRDGVATEVHPLWLEGRDATVTGRVPVAPDSDEEQRPVLLESTVLYTHKGAVYAVPVGKTDSVM